MVEEIENTSLAADIMYGSSPRDMVNRVIDNASYQSILNKIKHLRGAEQYVYDHLEKWLSIDQSNNFYFLGTYAVYVALLRQISKEKSEAFFNTINQKLSPDNFLYQINLFAQKL